MSTRFSRGISTPAILATAPPLTLLLLVLRIRAHDKHDAVPPDDSTFLAADFHRCSYLHGHSPARPLDGSRHKIPLVCASGLTPKYSRIARTRQTGVSGVREERSVPDTRHLTPTLSTGR